jgi:hypothetical protein
LASSGADRELTWSNPAALNVVVMAAKLKRHRQASLARGLPRLSKHGKAGGVLVHDNGRGTLDNDLTDNARGAWDIAEDCRDNVTRARNKE